MGFHVVHFEANGPDGEALASFYRDLFGWELRPVDGVDYWLVDTRGGRGINGGVGGTTEGGDAYCTFYVEADDPEPLLRRAVELGATVAMPVMETPMVTFGQFRDPDGLLVGLVKSAEVPQGTPVGPSEGDGAPIDWFEVLGTDGERTQRFYGELFGWSLQEGFPGYTLVDGSDAGIGGGVGAGRGPTWVTVYARVPDVEAALARAVELGGTAEYGPNQIPEGTRTAAFRDPAGNVFGLYTPPADQG